MIGSAARGLLATLVLGVLLSLRPAAAATADPAADEARQGAIGDAARVATLRVDELATVLAAARDAARRGSALVISGDRDPAPELLAAAAALEAGADGATRAQAAMHALDGIFTAVRPGEDAPALSTTAATLLGIASQLRGSAAPATVFVERRRASQRVLSALGDALAALERGDLQAAEGALASAHDAQAIVGAWEEPPAELSIWLATTTAMLDAVDRIVAALRVGDEAAATAAGAEYRKAADQAGLADRALTLAISEGGAAVTAAPLLRLARALEDVASTRDALAAPANP
jgi:hypothetical protein